MTRTARKHGSGALVLGLILGIATGCSGPRLVESNALLPPSGNASDAPTSLSERTRWVRTADEWTTPPRPGEMQSQPIGGSPLPPPPPPPYQLQGSATTYRAMPGDPCPPPCDPCPPVPDPCAPICGLPCAHGASQWHARLVVGWPFYIGTDEPKPCNYWGVDLGRTFCGCWGFDAYYRWAGCEYKASRPYANPNPPPDTYTGERHDEGVQHHFGLKATYEIGFGANSRFYAWGGLGGGYYATMNLEEDSEGWEIYAEVGIGYVMSEHWRLRAGLNAHGFDDEAYRYSEAEAGQARWMWLVAPVIQVECSF